MKSGYIGQRDFDRKTLTLLFSTRRIRQFLLSKLKLSHCRPGGFQLAALKNQIFMNVFRLALTCTVVKTVCKNEFLSNYISRLIKYNQNFYA